MRSRRLSIWLLILVGLAGQDLVVGDIERLEDELVPERAPAHMF